MKKIIAIIPAKKNSYRVKNKNLIKYKGKSLVEKAAIDALKSKLLHKVFLSSDSDQIRKKLKKYKNIHQFSKRSKKFSGRKTTMHSLVKYELKKIKIDYDYIMILQPTSPLRNSIDIDNACKLILKSKLNPDCLVSSSALPEDYHPKKIMVENEKFVNFFDLNSIFLNNIQIYNSIKSKNHFSYKNNFNVKKKLFFRNGAIYIISKKKVNHYLVGGRILNYEMPFSRSLDVNTDLDVKKMKLI